MRKFCLIALFIASYLTIGAQKSRSGGYVIRQQ